MLWSFLRNRKLGGLKFRRQHKIDRFILDFYCSEKRLCIEVDGAIHNTVEQRAKDQGRTAALEAHGIQVIRFSNAEVRFNIASVLEKILTARPPLHKWERGR
jgi:very-short-patch-repair endonuclease